ncbi:unnamed protein product [Bemisia tabaci]|uniref:Uncharacterized protein n=1 Tax=Bemisia tabaci TaxID=7038 RepID=A0A9P0EYN3_BEMTA|nr:unnamed protein product [Bemisia tabaci]
MAALLGPKPSMKRSVHTLAIQAPPFKRLFEGESDYEIRDFLKDFETHYRNYSDKEKREQLRCHLGKRAVLYYDNKVVSFINCRSFDEVKQKLIEYFDDEEDALERYAACKQKSDEDPLDFVQTKRKLARNLWFNISEAQLVQNIKMGLTPQYRAIVLISRDSTIQELVRSVKNAKLVVPATEKEGKSLLAINHPAGHDQLLESRVKAAENTLATLVSAVESIRADGSEHSHIGRFEAGLGQGSGRNSRGRKKATSFGVRRYKNFQQQNNAGGTVKATVREKGHVKIFPITSKEALDPSSVAVKSHDTFDTKIYPSSNFPEKNECLKSFTESNVGARGATVTHDPKRAISEETENSLKDDCKKARRYMIKSNFSDEEVILDKSGYDFSDSDTANYEPIYIRSVILVQDKNVKQEVHSLSDFNDTNFGSNAILSSISDRSEEIGVNKGSVESVTERGDPDSFKICKSEEKPAAFEVQEGDLQNIQIFLRNSEVPLLEKMQETGIEASKLENEVEVLTVTSDELELTCGLRVSGKQNERSDFLNIDAASREVYKVKRMREKKRGCTTANYTDDAKSEFNKKVCLKIDEVLLSEVVSYCRPGIRITDKKRISSPCRRCHPTEVTPITSRPNRLWQTAGRLIPVGAYGILVIPVLRSEVSPWAYRLIRKMSSCLHPWVSLSRFSQGISPIVIPPCPDNRAGEQPKSILGHPRGHAAVKPRAIFKPGSSYINLWAGSGAFLLKGRRGHQASGHSKASLDILGDTLQSWQGRSNDNIIVEQPFPSSLSIGFALVYSRPIHTRKFWQDWSPFRRDDRQTSNTQHRRIPDPYPSISFVWVHSFRPPWPAKAGCQSADNRVVLTLGIKGL